MPEIRLTHRQTAALEAGALEYWDQIIIMAQQEADHHGEPCPIYDAQGALLETAHPSPLCQSCFSGSAITDQRYCWQCVRNFADDYSLSRVAPFSD